MLSTEPHAIAVVLLTVGVVLGAAVLLGRLSRRSGVPLVVLFLALGMVAGSEGVGGISFEGYAVAFRIGTAALVVILFDGGMNTSLATARRAIAPAAMLATLGVGATAAILGVAARALGFTWTEAFLLGAIVSSTDAATVFSVLRGGAVRLEERVGATIEIESGLNDPMAVILTEALTRSLVLGEPLGPAVLGQIALQLVVGAIVGAGVGLGGRAMLERLRLPAAGLYPVLTLSLAFVAYGASALAHGSGFLAVYVAGILVGGGRAPYRAALLRVHDFAAWASQVVMFVVLGLLVFPSRLLAVAPTGLGLALVLAFVARPVAVALCLLPFRYRPREALYVGWVGLRGAVPIVLAIVPVLEGISAAHRIFNVVFFVVLLNTVLQGGSVRWLTGRLGLASGEPPPPEAVLEIASSRPLDDDVLTFPIDRASPLRGVPLADVAFPVGASLMLVVRGASLLAPRGATVLEAGDHAYVLCKRGDRTQVETLFGRAGEC